MVHCSEYTDRHRDRQTDRQQTPILRPLFQDNLGKSAPQTNVDFNEARDNEVAAGTYANRLHLAPDRYALQYLITQFLTGQMLFLTPNQQHHNTEGKLQ